MASSLMHLAVAGRLAERVSRPELLRLGCVLADAFGQAGHFRGIAADGRRFYDLPRFRAEYGDRLLCDDFCLGYYLHLVQDMVYRQMMHVEHGWNPHVPGNVERLHEDYRRLSPFLVRAYGLRPLEMPDGLAGHPLLADSAAAFLDELRGQFAPYDGGEPFFLTESLAAEYIDRAAEVCSAELDALRAGRPGADPMDYAYGLRIRELRPEEVPLLETFLYEAIFQRDPDPPLPRDVIHRPELWMYVDGFGSRRGDCCLCAEENRRVIGAVWTRIIPGYGHVDDDAPEFAISLLPDARGRGVGTRLMRAMLAELPKRGFARATLAVQKDNYALKMYQSVGFTVIGENDEEFIMEWRL